jgi:hypothetical protein
MRPLYQANTGRITLTTLTSGFASNHSEKLRLARNIRRALSAVCARIVNFRARREADIFANYASHGWNDASERRLIDDIATMRWRSFSDN